MYPKDTKSCLKVLKPKDIKRREAINYIYLIHQSREAYTKYRRNKVLQINEIRGLFCCFTDHTSVEDLSVKANNMQRDQHLRESYQYMIDKCLHHSYPRGNGVGS